jgi:hypothetical protein
MACTLFDSSQCRHLLLWLDLARAGREAKTAMGWTPLMMARGVFLTNTAREFSAAEAIHVKALAVRDARTQRSRAAA